MAFSRGVPNLREAARSPAPGMVNAHLLNLLTSVTKDVGALKVRTGAQAVDFDKRAPVSNTPGLAGIAVRPVNGIYTVVITNPEDVVSSNPLKNNLRNPARTTVLHRLAFSLTSGFGGDGNVQYYGPSTQTHWTIADLPATVPRYVRLESSFDGVNFNKAAVIGPF